MKTTNAARIVLSARCHFAPWDGLRPWRQFQSFDSFLDWNGCGCRGSIQKKRLTGFPQCGQSARLPDIAPFAAVSLAFWFPFRCRKKRRKSEEARPAAD